MPYIKTTFCKFLAVICLLFTLLPVWAAVDTKTVSPQAADPATGKPDIPLTVAVWPDGKMPGEGAKEPEADMPAKADGYRRITNISRPTLTVFPVPSKDAPAMIVCPGGGYTYEVYDKEGTEIAAWLNKAGIAAMVLKYRAPHNRDGAFQDVQRAIRVARFHAGEWNIDPKRVGVIGFSAGGHLAARASAGFDQSSYSAIDAVDKFSARPDSAVLVYPAYLLDKVTFQPAPEVAPHVGMPPILLVQTVDDPFLDAPEYAAALHKADVLYHCLIYDTGEHGYGLHSDKDVRVWPQAALDWLHTVRIP